MEFDNIWVNVNDDFLMHSHKYIKKIKTSNGKFRYIYDNNIDIKKKIGFTAKEKYEKAKSDKELQKVKTLVAIDEQSEAFKKARNSNSKQYKREEYDRRQNALNQMAKLEKINNKTNKIMRQYERTPIGKLHKIGRKGKQFLSKMNGFFNKKAMHKTIKSKISSL